MAADAALRRVIILTIIVLVVIMIIVLVVTLIYRARSSTSGSSTGCSSLPPPTNINIQTVGLTLIRVTWNAIPNAARYHIYIGSIAGFDKSTAFDDFLTGDTEYDIEGMVLGRTYYIRIATINSCSGEGILSGENSIAYIFPSKFRIVSRDQSSLSLTVAPDFNNIVVDSLCSGVPGDDFCIWSYDQSSGFMTTSSATQNCMKTFPDSVDYRVKYAPCDNKEYYNWDLARRWNYTPGTGSLCNPQNPEGLNCVKIAGATTPGQFTIRVPYDGDGNMQWDIVAV
jgi:hypothetical protein